MFFDMDFNMILNMECNMIFNVDFNMILNVALKLLGSMIFYHGLVILNSEFDMIFACGCQYDFLLWLLIRSRMWL